MAKAKAFLSQADERPFQLKQFSLSQSRTPIKVGTDALLLGAWTNQLKRAESVSEALDIGTGTGILALMLAQYFQGCRIESLEIDPDAQLEAESNFQRSLWTDRIVLYPLSLQDFQVQYQRLNHYDLIVSNPPFYSEATSSPRPARAQGRSQVALAWPDILAFAANTLKSQGLLALILPSSEWPGLKRSAQEYGLFPQRLCWVSGHAQTRAKRLLSVWGRHESYCLNEFLNVRNAPGSGYSEAYLALLSAYFPGKSV